MEPFLIKRPVQKCITVILGKKQYLINQALDKYDEALGDEGSSYQFHGNCGLVTRNKIHPEILWFKNFGNNQHYSEIAKNFEAFTEDHKTVVLTTMNPSVIERLWFTNFQDFLTRILFANENSGLMQTSYDEARNFFRNYTGFQHVSEILRWQGLW